MSDHAWILENLAAYLADGLQPAERERLETHTAECATCAAALSAAREMDTALSALFVQMRPSGALEDRAIQTLRTRSLASAWRSPLPAWLLGAAAALVLIGLTGALASQIVVDNGLAFPRVAREGPAGSMASTLLGYGDGAERLAEESRKSLLADLSKQPVLAHSYTPADISDGTSNTMLGTISEKTEPSKNFPPPATSKAPGIPSMGNGVGVGGTMGANGDAAGGQSPKNFGFWMGYTGGGNNSKDTSPQNPQAYFEPGKLLLQLPKDEVNAPKSGKQGQASGGGQGAGKGKDKRESEEEGEAAKKPGADKPQQAGPRKIVIRTGEVEYEVQSFDAAVATITRLVTSIKGGFVATVNSDKLANGKVRGSVTVRLPPEHLDPLLLELRTTLGKGGELKNQRIRSDDITKQYTDLESRLKAGRAMEERLLQIIKNGKGEIKDLLAVEKELGEWRTRIEEIEGNLRFYANQVSLSTLKITLFEKEIQAAFGLLERENVQMGLEVEDVDEALRAAQKAVREAKGRITHSELKQPSQGQFSALLTFEVPPDAAGPLRDRLKQLGTVARLDISRSEESQGGIGKPSDGKVTRKDTRFQVSLYNLTNVAPREVVSLNLACVDVETALKTVRARIEKAAGRVTSSSLSSGRGPQTHAMLQFEVKTPLADAVLEEIKNAGEVMRLQIAANPAANPDQTTRKKRGFAVQLFALEAASARETEEIQLACSEVAASYRAMREAVAKVKGRVRSAQLNEQDRRNVTATLDVEVRRAEEAVLRAALKTAGDIYTRKTSRAADGENVVDSKVRWQLTFLNQAAIPPRETYTFALEVADVDRAAATLTALVGERQGRVIGSDIARERDGRVTGKQIFDVPMAKVHEVLDDLRGQGTVRVQRSAKHPEVPDSPLAVARVEVTLSNKELIVPSDEGLGASVHRGLSDSFKILAWSLRLLIFGLCILLPWALVIWAIYRLVVRMRRRAAPASPNG